MNPTIFYSQIHILQARTIVTKSFMLHVAGFLDLPLGEERTTLSVRL